MVAEKQMPYDIGYYTVLNTFVRLQEITDFGHNLHLIRETLVWYEIQNNQIEGDL